MHRYREYLLLISAHITLCGCSGERPVNPSFPLSPHVARLAIKQMHDDRKPLPRPVIVLGGIHDPGFAPSHIADVIRDSVPDVERTRVFDIAFFGTWSFDSCADKLIRKLDERFPSIEPDETIACDVVAFSMGGLVARYAASDAYASSHGRRLKVARLFTISSPHQGAKLASLPTFDERAKDMRPGSAFLESLNADAAGGAYPVFAYVRLNDAVVGEEFASPPKQPAWWVARGFTLSHTLAGRDERILADILRRLRYEEPFSVEPAAPLPNANKQQ